MQARWAITADGMRRRSRASRMSLPSLRKALLTGMQAVADEQAKVADAKKPELPQIGGFQGPKTKGLKSSAGWTPPADAPPAPKEDNKVLKADGKVIAKSKGGQWVQP